MPQRLGDFFNLQDLVPAVPSGVLRNFIRSGPIANSLPRITIIHNRHLQLYLAKSSVVFELRFCRLL